jgi:predicted Zn-dependent peptidase
MLFKGTTNRTALSIADEMDAIGGQMNAYTTKDYTCFYARVLDSHTQIAFDVLSDMYLNPKFDETDIEKEINVVLEEINMRDDTPEDLAHDILQNIVWKGHALSRDITGTPKTVKKFNNAIIKDYYKNRYTPTNTLISIAGNFDDRLIEQIVKCFGTLTHITEKPETSRKAVYKPAISLMEKDVEQLHLCMGFEGIPFKSDDSYALSALLTYFGSGMSSRLYQRVREQHGLAYSIYSYGISSSDTGLVLIYAALNADSSSKVIDLILDEINLLRTDIENGLDLYKIKQQLKSNYLLSLESSNSRMASLGRGLLLRGEITAPDAIIQKIDGIIIDQIQSLVTKVFNPNKMSLSAVGDVALIKHDIIPTQ